MHTGAGDVTSSVPENSTVIAHFEGEEGNCELSCEVKNNGTQTDTVWSIENYMGKSELQTVTDLDDEMFTVSGDQHPLSESNYRDHLNISNCSCKELNGSIVYCGSHENRQQSHFEFKVCGML